MVALAPAHASGPPSQPRHPDPQKPPWMPGPILRGLNVSMHSPFPPSEPESFQARALQAAAWARWFSAGAARVTFVERSFNVPRQSGQVLGEPGEQIAFFGVCRPVADQ